MAEEGKDGVCEGWALPRWNDALVSAIFVAKDGARRPITRIDATSSFLVHVVGAAQSSEDVRRNFVRHFKADYAARTLFDRSVLLDWSPSDPDLPFFAQLYLSVMVASADEDTHDIGNFRERLAKMLDMPGAAYLGLDGLSVLWRAAAQWSVKTIRSSVRRLVLPDPGHENRIGYSKRLAFPGFRDQQRLAELLSGSSLTAESSATRVIREVARCIDQFSVRFQEEFDEFRDLYRSSDHRRALASPFWGALQDISWTTDSEIKDRVLSDAFMLELDIVDARSPVLMLRSDSPLSPRYLPWRSTHRIFYRDGRPHEIVHAIGDVRLSPDILLSPTARAFFGRSRAYQNLSSGCVAFAQDDFGAWVDVGTLSEKQPFWLLLLRVKAERLRAALIRAGHQPEICCHFGAARAWMLIGPLTFSERLRALIEPLIGDPIFEHRLVAPRIQVVGGVRLPEGYLFLPGCTPSVSMIDALSVRWSASTTAGLLHRGELVSEFMNGETTFAFVASDVREQLSDKHRIEIVALDGEGDVLDHTQVRAVGECSGWTVKILSDRRRWREIGDAGDLSGLERLDTASPQVAAEYLDIRPLATSAEWFAPSREVTLEEMPQRWCDMVEVLTAVFTRAIALPARDVVALVQRVWLVDGRSAWDEIQDLVDNGVMEHLFNRHWQGSVFVACAPKVEVAAVVGQARFRVLGLVPAALRREITAQVRAMAGCVTATVAPDGRTCGALQAQLPSLECVEVLCRRLELDLERCSGDEREEPLLPWSRLLATPLSEAKGELSIWSPLRRSFISDFTLAQRPLLERWHREDSQPLYVVRTERDAWGTRSRTWALLAYDALAGVTVGEIDAIGSLRLAHAALAMPPRIAREVLRRGGGVCYRDEMGRRVYLGSAHWAPGSMLAAWIHRPVGRAERDAGHERLRAALSAMTQVPIHGLRQYWSKPRRTS